MNNKSFKLSTALLSLMIYALTVQTAEAVNCGDYIAANVVLTSNLECNTGHAALEVVNHNVTIDLNGFTLSGPSALSGINVSGFNNLMVKNGSIKGFWAGINSSRADQLTVDNVTFYEVGYGVIIHAGNKARVQNNDFIKTTAPAVYINAGGNKSYTANQNLVSRNEFYRAAGGIQICGTQADENVISDNLIWKSSDYGIHLNHSDWNQIYRNRILETNATALRLKNSSYNEVKENSVREGTHVGVSVLGNAGSGCSDGGSDFSGKNQFSDNQISGFWRGINLGLGLINQRNVDGTRITDNQITDNNIGIHAASDSSNSNIIGNDFTNTTTPIIDFGVNNRY